VVVVGDKAQRQCVEDEKVIIESRCSSCLRNCAVGRIGFTDC